jgi:hypothetical protein
VALLLNEHPPLPSPLPRGERGQGIGLALLFIASLAVFMLYTHPDFIVDTANQVWFCFQ